MESWTEISYTELGEYTGTGTPSDGDIVWDDVTEFETWTETGTFSDDDYNVSELNPYYYTSAPCILLSLQVIMLNSFVINHYKKNRKSFVPMMYLMISTVDIVTAVGVIHQSIATSLFANGLIDMDTLKWNFVIFYGIIALSYRTSVFYNVVLGVTRTINILDPFYRIKKRVVIAACIVYPTIWTGAIAYDIYYSLFREKLTSGALPNYLYFLQYPLTGQTLVVSAIKPESMTADTDSMTMGIEFYGLFVMFVAVPFLLPAVVVLMTCIAQVVSLYKSNMGVNDNQRHVTITILLISILFVICNSVFSIYMLIIVFYDLSMDMSNTGLYLCGAIFGTLLPIINAAFNPVIIISRSSGVRKEFLEAVKKVKGSIRSTTTDRGTVSTLANTTNAGTSNAPKDDAAKVAEL